MISLRDFQSKTNGGKEITYDKLSQAIFLLYMPIYTSVLTDVSLSHPVSIYPDEQAIKCILLIIIILYKY
jgi:hypothetical protein